MLDEAVVPEKFVHPHDLTKGVGAFMGTVYAWMAAGVASTAGVATYIGSKPEMMEAMFSEISIILLLLPFGLIIYLGKNINKMRAPVAGFWYLTITSIIGTWLSSIGYMALEDPGFAQNVGYSLVTTVGMFVGLSLFGWITKKDLTGMGSFMFAAMIGLILTMVVGMFFQSPQFDFLISCVGVLIFSGLIAFDTQNIKQKYLTSGGGHALAITGALELFLDFLNMFQFLLHLVGIGDDD